MSDISGVIGLAGFEAGVEGGGDGFAVEVAADEDELDHAVTVFFVPVAAEAGFAFHHYHQFFLGRCGVP